MPEQLCPSVGLPNMDLTPLVTVFVISVGNNPNYQNCLDALSKQTCTFKVDIIKDYAPMGVAFQEMLNRAQTPYFIQVDEDMILQPNAVQTMFESINGTEDTLSMKCFRLRDVHLDFPIYGVKIYKTELFKKYPFNLEYPSCEVEQLERMTKDGIKYSTPLDILGEHSPLWSDEAIFERYFNLLQKYRIFGYKWMGELPRKLAELHAKFPTDNNFYALAGMMHGLMKADTMAEEKDFRKHRVEFARIKSAYARPTSATVYATSKCNFKCTWCRNQEHGDQTAPDIHPTDIETLLLKYPTITGVCICGYGEPLMVSNMRDILAMIRKHGKASGIITNGSLLKARLPLLLLEPPSYISVSLNAHNEEEHQKVTRTNQWFKVIRGIEACVASTIPCYISHVITKENIHYVPEAIKLAKSLGVKGLYLHNLLPHYKDNAKFWDLVMLDTDQHYIDEWKKLPEASIVTKWPVLIDRKGGYGVCEFPWKSIAIDGLGSISICNSVLPCAPENGSIRDRVNDTFHNEYCKKFREDFTSKAESLPCDKCFRNWSWM